MNQTTEKLKEQDARELADICIQHVGILYHIPVVTKKKELYWGCILPEGSCDYHKEKQCTYR